MSDLRQFSAKMKKTGKAVADNAPLLTRRVALAVDANLIFATPVDTGRARSNWQVQIGEAAVGIAEPMSVQESLNRARVVIAAYKGGSVIHITNNLPYIGRLNDGHSAQAPANFVEQSCLNGSKAVKGTSVLTGKK